MHRNGQPTLQSACLAWRTRLLIAVCCASASIPSDGHGQEVAPELSQRRERVAALSQADREHLARQQRRFSQLSPEEQQRLRSLDAELADDPRQAELRHVMFRYYAWLETLSPAQREELRQLPPDERLARVQNLRGQQNQEESRRLADEDRRAVLSWLREVRLAKAPEKHRLRIEAALAEQPEENRDLHVLFEMSRLPYDPEAAKMPLPTDEEWTELHGRLSPTAQQQLAAADNPRLKNWLVMEWLGQIARDTMQRRPGKPGPEDLEKFFAELPATEQRELMSLDPENRKRQLWHSYIQKHRPNWPGGFQRGGFPHGAQEEADDGRPQRRKRGLPPGKRQPPPDTDSHPPA